jgi:hypothetical protein
MPAARPVLQLVARPWVAWPAQREPRQAFPREQESRTPGDAEEQQQALEAQQRLLSSA